MILVIDDKKIGWLWVVVVEDEEALLVKVFFNVSGLKEDGGFLIYRESGKWRWGGKYHIFMFIWWFMGWGKVRMRWYLVKK